MIVPKGLTTEEGIRYQSELALREARYVAHVATMTLDPRVMAWAGRMAEARGPRVRIWYATLGWVEALMVARYGEDVRSWPTSLTEADVACAEAWEAGRQPNGAEG